MSCSPYFYIEKLNNDTNKYEKITLYHLSSKNDKTYEEIDVWPWNGTHDVFDSLTIGRGEEICGIHVGVPANVSEDIKKVIDEYLKDIAPFTPKIYYITLADLYVEYYKNPMVADYDVDWEGDITNSKNAPKKENPVKKVIDRIESIVDLADQGWDLENERSDIRLVYWLSY